MLHSIRITYLTAMLAWGSSTWAMDFIPYAKPDAVLAKDQAAQRLVLWKSLLIEGYRQQGDHGHPTDADMTKLMAFTASKMLALAPSDQAMSALAQRLAGPGGNPDPLAAFAWFQMCVDQGRNASSAAWLTATKAFATDDASHQPPRYAHLIRALLLVHALEILRPRAHPEQLEQANAITEKLQNALVASVTAHEFDLAPSSFLRCVNRIELDQPESAEALITALTSAFDTAKTEPWVAHASLAALGIKVAWAWRGSGWASSVTPEGGKGFARHMAAAQTHLTEAYRLHPGEPMLGVTGIILAGAGYSTIGIDEWLRRSMAACLDALEPWDKMRSFSTPRWGGSYDHMLGLGCDAVATKRFDTMLPRQLFFTMSCVVSDARSMKQEGNIKAPLSKPRVRQAVTDCIAGYIANDPSTAAEYHSLEVGYLWHCGDQAGARKALLAIDPPHRHEGAAKLLIISYDQVLADTEPPAKVSF